MYTGLGLLFIALGIHFSNHIKTVLSNKYLLWLGKNSFAVYLLHGTLMRTLLTYMYYGISLPPNVTNDKGESVPGPALSISGRVRFWFWLPIWFAITYTAAHFWTKYVDPWCAKLTQRLENYCFEETQAQPANKEYISPLPR
jgi:peptidoglycan/LPS O-acetylase OafA/YrhL